MGVRLFFYVRFNARYILQGFNCPEKFIGEIINSKLCKLFFFIKNSYETSNFLIPADRGGISKISLSYVLQDILKIQRSLVAKGLR